MSELKNALKNFTDIYDFIDHYHIKRFLRNFCSFLFFKFYLFLERGEGRKKEKHQTFTCKKNIVCLLHTPNQGPGPQPRHVPDPGSNWRPLGLRDDAPYTEPHQPGLVVFNLTLLLRVGVQKECQK